METLAVIEEAPALVPTLEVVALGLAAVGLPLFGLEVLGLWRSGKLDSDRLGAMLTNAFCVVPYVVAQLLAASVVGVALVGVASVTPLAIPTTWATALLCVLLVDFAYYWEHRISHHVNWFWASFHCDPPLGQSLRPDRGAAHQLSPSTC